MSERKYPLRNAITGDNRTTGASVWAETLRNLKRDELAAIVVEPVALAVLEAIGREMKPARGRSEMIYLAVREYIERHTGQPSPKVRKPGPKGKK
jgi:hypothetical protein